MGLYGQVRGEDVAMSAFAMDRLKKRRDIDLSAPPTYMNGIYRASLTSVIG